MWIEYLTFNGEKRKLKEWVSLTLFLIQIIGCVFAGFTMLFLASMIIYLQ
jgi:hypothetical protein